MTETKFETYLSDGETPVTVEVIHEMDVQFEDDGKKVNYFSVKEFACYDAKNKAFDLSEKDKKHIEKKCYNEIFNRY